ncbi:MAG TPA: glutathione S-transferase family protein [Steroidobacteraceae bacterium]|nr:glutathione S-transferase family protein [Steroidobacteraceae bacterium]
MILIGMFDSPFVRRVAVSLALLELPFEHRSWSVGRDFERIRAYNPLGRVPTLVIGETEVLMESGAILDYLDDLVGEQRALLPARGAMRREALLLMALATGAADKGVAQLYEQSFRPEEKRHAPWVERCRTQMHSALGELERRCSTRGADRWLLGSQLTQADVTVGCVFTFLTDALGLDARSAPYPALWSLVGRCEALPAFAGTRRPFAPPGK